MCLYLYLTTLHKVLAQEVNGGGKLLDHRMLCPNGMRHRATSSYVRHFVRGLL